MCALLLAIHIIFIFLVVLDQPRNFFRRWETAFQQKTKKGH